MCRDNIIFQIPQFHLEACNRVFLRLRVRRLEIHHQIGRVTIEDHRIGYDSLDVTLGEVNGDRWFRLAWRRRTTDEQGSNCENPNEPACFHVRPPRLVIVRLTRPKPVVK